MENIIVGTTTPLPYLPENIIEEILLLLPARSIAKFRAATKLFNRLSTQPSFVSAHTQRSLAAPPSLLVLLPERLKRFVQINPDESCIDYDYLRGTCDGLLLFSERNCPVFTVVNPATGQWTPVSVAEEDTNLCCNILGFYRQRSSGTHRLLIELIAPGRLLVLTIGSNEVRDVGSSESYYFFNSWGVAGSDGKLYVLALWTAHCVVIFDTEKESLNSIAVPDEIESLPIGWSRWELAEMDGRVCMYIVCSMLEAPYFRVEMWILVDSESGVWLKKRTRTHEVVQGWGEGLFVVYGPGWLHYFPKEKDKEKLLLARWGGNDVCSTEKEFSFYCLDDDVVRKEVLAMRRRFLLSNPFLCASDSDYEDDDQSYSLCIEWYRELLTSIDR